ncbi:MAG: hypothetical protein K0Q94_1223 [Paenibacillus sp.]|uniref:hypothetical protein n=1 Tax=Paenibacillus sp. GCM10012303 TaxID=3317340 RepID=UPI0029ECFBC8|nr:hypothetical protein [Paenibacillus sp.]
MPGSIVHMIVQQRLGRAMRKTNRDYAELLSDSCSPYAAFGSIGPDFLFFSLKEYDTPLDDLVNFMFSVYDAMEPLRDFYEHTIQPVEDAIDDATAALDEALFQGLFSQIKDTAALASNTLLTAAGKVVTSHVDLFYPFYPKIQQGAPEKEWYWFDFLHYRRTGQFCSNMWNLAQGDKDLMKYCLGYASHIGTDVVGHPFVNSIVGGPFRTHWHRHKLVENWIDAYARKHYPDSRAITSCLRLTSKDTYIPDAISGSYYYRLCEFPDGKLPEKLQHLLVKAMDVTYSDIEHPISMNGADLDTTYRLWMKWYERSTTIGDAKKPVPVPPPGSATAALINDYTSGFPSPPSSGPSGGGFSVGSILEALFAFAKWLADVVEYTIDWIITHAKDILTLPYLEATGLIKWLLYQIQKGIWEIYDNVRFSLVLGGYLFPEPRDLDKMPWGKALLNTAYAHTTGGAYANFYQYPRKQESHGMFGTTEHHLIYPTTAREREHAEPAPKPFHGQYPEAFISGSWPFQPLAEHLHECDDPYGEGMQFTHHVDSLTWDTAQFGSAIDFCARLIGERMEKLPDYNLDGDRGYGWKTWVAKNDLETSNPVETPYLRP